MLNILPNQNFLISPAVESTDTGWTISGQIATHLPCNPGVMRSIGNAGLVVGKTYVVTYEVLEYHSGGVRVRLGNTSGTLRTAPGIYTEELQCTGTAQISFFSDGWLSVNKNLKYYELVNQADNAVTLAFFDKEGNDNKKWATHYSYSPELMINFINSFFTVKNGALWQHNVNEIRNNFYGQQYKSTIQFYDNLNPTTVKLFYSMRVEANTPWYCPNNGDISILPIAGKISGMSSRLKKNNFRNYQGSFFGDFMRNYLDSRFNDPEKAIYSGEPLRGRFMQLNMVNADITETVLFEIDVKSSASNITY